MWRAIPWLAIPTLIVLGAAVRAESSSAPEPPDPVGEVPVLERAYLIELVVDRNPSLRAAYRAWEAARAEIPIASSLDDPQVSLSVAPRSLPASSPRSGEILRVSQRLPYPGTLRRRAAVAEATASAVRQHLEATRLRLATESSRLYDHLWRIARVRTISQEHLALLETLKRVATGRYAAGEATQQAPLQAEVEEAGLRHRLLQLEREERSVRARLNALLHRPASAPLPPVRPVPDALEVTGEPLAPQRAVGSRPEIVARREQLEALRGQVELAELRLRPDLEVTTAYNSMWSNSEHRWTVGVGVRLPLRRDRLHAAVAAAEARLDAARHRLDALLDRTTAEVEIARAALEASRRTVRLYRAQVLPAARDQLAAARSGFETGTTSMMELIDAARSLLRAEIAQARALAELATARAELDHSLGRMPWSCPVAHPCDAGPGTAPGGRR